MELPERLAATAERQFGLLARWQCLAHLGAGRTDALLRSDRFTRVHRGVYAVRGGAVHRHRGALAAALRAGPGATLSGPAAVELGGPEGLVLGRGFVLLLPSGARMTGTDLPTRPDRDPAREVNYLGTVRVALPADALLDSIAGSAPPSPRQLRLCHDQLRWAGQLAAGELGRRAAELRYGREVTGHELLDLDATAATGDGERRLGALLCQFDPPPQPQVWVTPHRRVDWWFETVRIGLEYQGRVDHDGAAGRRADQVRDEELAMAGVRLLYTSARDLRDERVLLATVAGALAARAHELGVAAPHLRGD